MKSYGLYVVGFSSGLDVGFDVGYVVLEKQEQSCIESDPHASGRDAQHHRTKRQKTKDKIVTHTLLRVKRTKCIIKKLTGCQ